MGLPRDARDFWAVKRQSFLIPSPHENNNNTAQRQLTYEEEKVLRAKRCTDEGVREGVKAAGIACVTSAIPTLIGVRVIPWAKANLKYTAQALIISTGNVSNHSSNFETCIVEFPHLNIRDVPLHIWIWFLEGFPPHECLKPNSWDASDLLLVLIAWNKGVCLLSASLAAYFIVAEKTILECSRQNTIKQYKAPQDE